MYRKLMGVLALVLIVGTVILLPSSVDAQSSGCASVSGLSGFVSEFDSVSMGAMPFVTGETISVISDVEIELVIGGAQSSSSSGTSVSYTIPEDGSYSVTVARNSDSDATITVSCSVDGTGNTGGTGIYNTFAFSIYSQGNGVYHIWGDCLDATTCQIIAIIDLYRVGISPTRFQENYGGNWYVDVYVIASDAQSTTYQFNIYDGGGLLDDGFTVTIAQSGDVAPPANDPDGDGFIGDNDVCPQVAGAVSGCPDNDGDGFIRFDDRCPEIAGTVNGCPDADGDGIVGNNDDCPDVYAPNGINGCPDDDGDGVIDSEDACPDVAGIASASGCPDADGDGVIDSEDACPNGVGSIAANGCPDDDGDGVINIDDQCPDVAGRVILNGCLPSAVTNTQSVIVPEVVSFEDQCFYVSILARAPDDFIPLASTPPSRLPMAGGEFSILAELGVVLVTQGWEASIGYAGEMSYRSVVIVPAGGSIGNTLEVVVLEDVVAGEDPFIIDATSLLIRNSDCGPIGTDGTLDLFTYADILGSFDDLIVVGIDVEQDACTNTLPAGVPIMAVKMCLDERLLDVSE